MLQRNAEPRRAATGSDPWPDSQRSAGDDPYEPLLRLSFNECPEPPPAEVLAAARAAMADVNRYPDPRGASLRAALAERFGVPVSCIALGNGSGDILLAIADALLAPGSEYVCAWPTFGLFRELARRSGATARLIALNDRHEHDLVAMANAITQQTRVVLLCNPNNPTSTALTTETLADFIAVIPSHVWVVLDEAYIEYSTLNAPDASLKLLATRERLVLLRTFSKVYGLCGLRVGYALSGCEAFSTAVDSVRQPFFCNSAAQAAAVEALKHADVIAARVAAAIHARRELTDGLCELGIRAAQSQTNFVWFDLPAGATSEQHVVLDLAERGVLVRPGQSLGRPGALRVSCGTPPQNAQFLNLLSQVL